MTALFLFLILVVGYYYASKAKIAKINLRRSAGWETYVYLGWHGVRFTLLAILVSTILYFPLFVLLSIIDWLFSTQWKVASLNILKYVVFDNVQVYHLIIAFLTYSICKINIDDENKQDLQQQLKQLAQHDGMLSIILEAANKQKTIRVSLKSKKVYVGLILEEQFERVDLDCIVLVPLVSGYRDKDTLSVFFDCNYYPVYDKNQLFSKSEFSKDDMLRLEDFRLAIRISEVESVSFFDFSVIDEFEYYEKINNSHASS